MTIFLALLGPLAIGFGDHVAIGIGRKTHLPTMVWWIFLYTMSVVTVFSFLVGGDPSLADMAYGAASGLFGAWGLMELFRGYTTRGVGIVGPVSAVLGAIMPVAAGIITTGLPTAAVAIGILVGLAALWLIGHHNAAGEWDPVALRHGLRAGAAIGGMTTLLGLTAEGSGLWPLLGGRVTSFVFIGIFLLAGGHSLKPERSIMPGLAFIGAMGAVGMGSYLLAAQRNLAIAGLLFQMLYGFTLIFQIIFAGERTSRSQLAGFALAAVSLSLIILG